MHVKKSSSKNAKHNPQDFSATVNMLMMLSKADLKLKSATRDDEDDTGDERAGSREGRRSSSGGAGKGCQMAIAKFLDCRCLALWA